MLISKAIPNMVNGVSQQPAAMRLESQCEVMVNAYPTVVEGMRKRPATQHVAKLTSDTPSNVFLHTLNRDTQERYLLYIRNREVRVFDLDGVEYTVNCEGSSRDYLEASNPVKDFRAVTIADYTFIANRKAVVEMDTTLTPDPGREALLWVKQATAATDFIVEVDSVEVANYRQASNTSEAKGVLNGLMDLLQDELAPKAHAWSGRVQTHNAQGLTYGYIDPDFTVTDLNSLYVKINGEPHSYLRWSNPDAYPEELPGVIYIHARGTNWGVGAQGAYAAIPSGDPVPWEIKKINNEALYLRKLDGSDFSVKAVDSRNGACFQTIKGTKQRFSELPTVGKKDMVIEIIGDNTTSFDNYFVKFVPDNEGKDFDHGHWKETVKPGIKRGFKDATLPHALIRESDGSFTFKALEWDDRSVGDEKSSPEPTFVGKTINDVFFHQNRLGFLSDENVILSETGEYFNFFPATVTTLLDSDPIDKAASNSKVSILRAAINFGEELYFFSDQTQFLLDYGDILSPRTVNIKPVTDFESTDVTPVNGGKNIYFAVDKGSWTGLREYYIDADSNTKDAIDVTSHVPKYIPSGLTRMDSSSNVDTIALLSNQDQQSLYLYKFFWAGNEKLQSAWFRFQFSGQVTGMAFFDTNLYLIIQHGDGTYLERMPLQIDYSDPDAPFDFHLDRKTNQSQVTGLLHDPTSRTSTFDLPFAPDTDIQVVTNYQDQQPGEVFSIEDVSGTTVTVRGDLTGRQFTVGERYEMRYRFSMQTIKEAVTGGGKAVVGQGRLQLRFFTLLYDNTGYFRAEVTPLYRTTKEYPFTGRLTGAGENKLGTVPISSGKFRFPVLSRNDQVTIDIVNDTYLPSRIISADWEGSFFIRSKRF